MKQMWSALLIATWSLPVVGQQQPTLDRVLQTDMFGEAAVWMPGAVDSGILATRVAFAGRVPVVFEAAPDTGRDTGATPTRLMLAGHTVAEALDALVASDARYGWREVDGVLVIRPTAAADDRSDPLNIAIANVTWEDVTTLEALRRIGVLISGTPIEPKIGAPLVDGRRVSINVQTGTVLDVVVAIARAHGALLWTSPDLAQSYGAGSASLGVQTFDGRGAGIGWISVVAP
jgi:hypothetical protein